MKIEVFIVDDEQGARESLKNIIEKYFAEELLVLGTSGDVTEAFEAIKLSKPDLVFLDIEMPKGGGFNLLSKFEDVFFNVVFVTAYDQYAIKAIKFSALDYLLKPIDMDELEKAIQKHKSTKSQERVEKQKIKNLIENIKSENHIRKIAVPDGNGLIFIPLKNIVRCESDGNYTIIYQKEGKKIVASRTLGDFDDMFSGENFFRIHRSHLINLEHLVKYVKGEGGYVEMSDGSKAEVSRRKKSDFMDFLQNNPL
jgi:two-component system, LytTR family, response regulator